MIYKIYIRLFVIDINCDRMTGCCWLLQQLLRHAHSGGRIGSVRIRHRSCVGLGDFYKFTVTAISRCIFHGRTGAAIPDISCLLEATWCSHGIWAKRSGGTPLQFSRSTVQASACTGCLHRIIWEESFWFMWNKEDRFEVFTSMSCSKTWLVG